MDLPLIRRFLSKIANSIHAVLKFDVNGCRGIATQEEHKLHETRVCRSKLRVRNLVVDDPFGVIGETVKNKDVAASHLRVPSLLIDEAGCSLLTPQPQSRSSGDLRMRLGLSNRQKKKDTP